MLHFYVCDLKELSKSLVLLRKDLILFSKFDGGISSPILYKNRTFSKINYKHHHAGDEKPGADEILESLISCNFYLDALLEERIDFDEGQRPINEEVPLEANEEKDEHIFSSVNELKKYFEIFKEKAWKIFAEINSLCALTRSQYKTLSVQEAEEVIYAFKHSLEVYERAVTFDISHPDNAATVFSALQNVKKSTRAMQSYVWMVKTMMTHSTPNSNE